ncbi:MULTISPECIES: signal peptidase II [Dyadobacter]|uniref:Lipoprotein signal peptidase n=1 Tax=Dyadobacter chenhuakuii TaxID=2909339 RepID=A0A9X1QBP3_9BACT|nr:MULTISPECIES: signal peptidase II [Dyadobacter]MCE7072348.1 signal peptidase II [Dyadobacter sp. CY327]MCF2497492.1 signal peptidase II [Dyadobacter chenhuakuii]MCF2519667.1 signal peptidase II [Dyadobacter sp. CY351]
MFDIKSDRLIRNIAIFLILISNFGCDQISKNVVRKNVGFYQTISVVEDIVTITYVENTGAFLSIGAGLPHTMKVILLSVIPLIVLFFGVAYILLKRNLTLMSALALSFAIGGGIGNIYDRLMHGSVTDFLHINLGFFQTGIFNMADVSIMMGMFIFFIQSYTRQKARILR